MLPRKLVIICLMQQVFIHSYAQDTETTTSSIVQVTDGNAVTVTEALINDRSSHVHIHQADHSFKGFWRKSFAWRPRWVKTWQPRKIYVAVWKKMWGPAVTKEWVPVPKPPPGWASHDKAYAIKVRPH